jgi:monothiol glutaredoxin
MPDVLEKIKSEIGSNKVVLFMKGTPQSPQCGFSAATVQILNAFNRPFKGIDILANPDIRATLPQYSNWPTFPQLFINGKLVGGCDIVQELKDSGELKQLLDEAFGGA